MSNIFDIKGANCSYNNKDIVLTIPDLQLERGEVHFFIGPSGIGKSTLLELLGVMNYPIIGKPMGFSYIDKENSKIDISDLWSKNDLTSLAKFRQSEFSFIFQQTNLMPYFSAGENVAFTLMLNEYSWSEAKQRVLAIMDLVKLPSSFFDRKIQNMSGGQRQRLAFARAFVAPFEVICCDEPTGNLDAKTAKSVMRVLRNFVKEKNKTAIIVSHDIPLAAAFADKIHFFTSSEQNNTSVGYLSNENQYFKNEGQWYDGNMGRVEDIYDELEQIL